MAEALLEAADKAAGIDREKMDALELLGQGKRNLLCGEVAKAVNQLQEVCEQLAKKFGETADECGEAYFYYGKALLELSRIESGVLGNALQGIEEDEAEEKLDDVVEKDDMTAEEKEKISDEILDAMLETDEEVKARLEKEMKTAETKQDKVAENENDKVKDENKDVHMETDEKKDASKNETTLKPDSASENPDDRDVKSDKKILDDSKKDTMAESKDTVVKEDTSIDDNTKGIAVVNTKNAVVSDSNNDAAVGSSKTGVAVVGNGKDDMTAGDKTETAVADSNKDATAEGNKNVNVADSKKDAAAGDEKSEDGDMEIDEKKDAETSQEEGGESEDLGDEGSEELEGTEEDGEVEGSNAEGDAKKGEGSSDKKEEDDVSNLQLAWEMLELSKVIFKRNNSRESKLKLADSFLKLGEVCMESEQYETAISDLKECLRLQTELLDPDERALAETYYQLGLACTFHALYDDAADYYRKASSTIEARIANLKKVIDGMEGKGKEKADPDDPLVKAQKEVQDLENIIPDIMAKIEDVLDEKRNAEQVKQMVKENLTSSLEQISTTTTGFGQTEQSTSKLDAVQDITHLVRKRKKVDEDVEDVAKKSKTQDGASGDQVNGTVEVNGKAPVNGQASKLEVSAS